MAKHLGKCSAISKNLNLKAVHFVSKFDYTFEVLLPSQKCVFIFPRTPIRPKPPQRLDLLLTAVSMLCFGFC